MVVILMKILTIVFKSFSVDLDTILLLLRWMVMMNILTIVFIGGGPEWWHFALFWPQQGCNVECLDCRSDRSIHYLKTTRGVLSDESYQKRSLSKSTDLMSIGPNLGQKFKNPCFGQS